MNCRLNSCWSFRWWQMYTEPPTARWGVLSDEIPAPYMQGTVCIALYCLATITFEEFISYLKPSQQKRAGVGIVLCRGCAVSDELVIQWQHCQRPGDAQNSVMLRSWFRVVSGKRGEFRAIHLTPSCIFFSRRFGLHCVM